jgi:hypothetical protein
MFKDVFSEEDCHKLLRILIELVYMSKYRFLMSDYFDFGFFFQVLMNLLSKTILDHLDKDLAQFDIIIW